MVRATGRPAGDGHQQQDPWIMSSKDSREEVQGYDEDRHKGLSR